MAASVTTGVLNPVIGKLTKLLGDEYKKLTGVRKQAEFLKKELSAMNALLEEMELMEKLDPTAKNWRDHVREMSYDMENCIDDFMHDLDLDGADAKAGFVKKMAKRLKGLGKRHQIANRMEELKVLAVEANARRVRYEIDHRISKTSSVVLIDPRVSAIYKEAAGLVGIDGPREELVSLLMDSQEELKVVAIVGFGGLGKTTLAKQVYDQIGGNFDCKAFFSVSQKPDVKNLLIGLHCKLVMKECSHDHQLQDIIDLLREYLKHKRYFILVDDLWDQPVWNIISCVFPENSNGSRVMVTTRMDNVAAVACHNDRACIYRMKHLLEQDSRRLFFRRVFGSENACPAQFQDISYQILKKCGGLPLAIITIASLLASHEARALSEWESIKNSLSAKSATQLITLEEMRGILNLSYIHLPAHLRPCLLYLGMYPEDREIFRTELIQQWIAEGFVYRLHGVDSEDVAKSYFNELINRSLIQPKRIRYGGEVNICTIHDMILDLIVSKCTEGNFASVAYNYEDMARLHSCEYKVRRLSLKSSAGDVTSETLATSMSQVRSYAQFGESKYTPHLSQFKYLRILLFGFPIQRNMTVDLTAIGHLFLLRVLKVLASSADVALPTEIQGLLHLETLELWCKSAVSFPSDVSRLANLVHLVLPDGIVLPKGIQNMKAVRTLECSGILQSSVEDIKGLSNLTKLKELISSKFLRQHLTVERVDRVDRVDALVSSIGMLRDLKRLTLECKTESDGSNSQLDSLSDPPPLLEALDLYDWKCNRVPKWIGELRCLRILHLHVLHLSNDEVRVLGELPSLVFATLGVVEISQNKAVISTGLFPVLEDVWFDSYEDVTTYLSFEEGAMRKLQRLDLTFGCKEWGGATPVGMEWLPCLTDIHVRLMLDIEDWRDVCRDVKSAFKRAVQLHPKHPSLTVFP